MAGRTTNAATKTANNTSTERKVEKPVEELNLDAKVTVKNLAGWKVTFARLHDGVGDIVIAENGKQRLSRNEVQAQINSGNKLFVGTDGRGSHATIYIDDAPTREWVGFDDDGEKQLVFTDDTVKKMFSMTDSEFEINLPKYIATRAEKYAFIEAIKRLGFNDYRKMVLASNYTGYKI